MAGSQIFSFAGSVEARDTLCRSRGNGLIHMSAEMWRTVRIGITSIRCGIECAGVTSDRKRLRLLCQQRHRLWD
jgi:hypothetical protein